MATSLIVKIAEGRGAAIEGLALLALTEQLAQAATVTAPGESKGKGTKEDPFKLSTAQEWLWAVKNYKTIAKHPLLVYLSLAGRLIGGTHDCYISDYGPVWRKGVEPGIQSEDSADFGVTSPEALAGWQKSQKSIKPSYQTIAQRINDPARIFGTPADVESDVRTWKDVSRTPLLVAAIRTLLEQKSLWNNREVKTATRQYSRIQRLLPALVGAMYLGEPARNIRAWPINMMLLDMVQAGAVFGPISERLDWVNIIWHPLALEISRENPGRADEPVGQNIYGPEEGEANKRNMILVPRLGRLHLVGGAMPASPTGGGKFGRVQIEAQNEKQLGTFRKQPKFDYIHRKEIDVLLEWLKHVIPNSAPGDERPTITYDQLRNPDTVGDQQLAIIIRSIEGRIRTRIGSLAAM